MNRLLLIVMGAGLVFLSTSCNRQKKAKNYNAYLDTAKVTWVEFVNQDKEFGKWVAAYKKDNHAEYKKKINDYVASIDKMYNKIKAIEVKDDEIKIFQTLNLKAIDDVRKVYREVKDVLDRGEIPQFSDKIKKFYDDFKKDHNEFFKERAKYFKKYKLVDRKE